MQAVIASQKVAGKNVSVDVSDGYGSVISVSDRIKPTLGACCFFDGACFSDPDFHEADCIASSGTWVPGGTCDPNTCPDFSVCCQAGLRITATFTLDTYCLDLTALECNVEFIDTVSFGIGTLTVRLTPTFGGIANFEITYTDGVISCHFFDATADCINGPGSFSCTPTGSINATLNRVAPYCP